MLELRTTLKRVIEPLVYVALEAPLRGFGEAHWREADRNNLTTVTFRRSVAALAAKYFAERRGLVKWRGVINQPTATRQLLVEITRLVTSHYRCEVKRTGIRTEDITRLTRQCRSGNNP